MKHFEIYDDFLPQDYFKHLDTQILHKNRFRWLFQEKVATHEDDPDDEQFYFISSFYHNLMVEDDFYYELVCVFLHDWHVSFGAFVHVLHFMCV